ncbi:MAG: hypothetical protein HIU91_10105 [Acidobacteria bacterium]|nr:hypothetical protein [Acidobacteriota bacterium]
MTDTADRTAAEIETELHALNGLRNQVPPTSAFGDDNHEAITAQIRVIREGMTYEKLVAEYEEGNAEIFNAALNALGWLYDDDTPPSDWWAALVEEPVAA